MQATYTQKVVVSKSFGSARRRWGRGVARDEEMRAAGRGQAALRILREWGYTVGRERDCGHALPIDAMVEGMVAECELCACAAENLENRWHAASGEGLSNERSDREASRPSW